MTPQGIALVQSTWQRVEPAGTEVAGLFYARLFELDPALRPLFRAPVAIQGARLVAMIGTAVRALDDVGAIADAVRDLGRRHAGYGVRPAHYGTVGEALLWTLERGLGAGFTAEVIAAWTEVYLALAGLMQSPAPEPAGYSS